MNLQLNIATCSRPTGEALKQLLIEKDIRIGGAAQGIVCFGVGSNSNLPTLNGSCSSRDNLQQLETLMRAGVSTPPFAVGDAANQLKFPLLAREVRHRGGKDIKVTFQPEEIGWRMAAGAGFFTEYIPHSTEYRVWIYRQRHLATYEKSMARPNEYKFIGRNYRNGFIFNRIEPANVNKILAQEANKAVIALGLDFGAVDILHGKDGKFYVLEVNTAPGVEGPGRVGLRALANRISRWAAAGFPKRTDRLRDVEIRNGD